MGKHSAEQSPGPSLSPASAVSSPEELSLAQRWGCGDWFEVSMVAFGVLLIMFAVAGSVAYLLL